MSLNVPTIWPGSLMPRAAVFPKFAPGGFLGRGRPRTKHAFPREAFPVGGGPSRASVNELRGSY